MPSTWVRRKGIVLLALLMISAAISFLYFAGLPRQVEWDPGPSNSGRVAPEVGAIAPNFSLTALNGKLVQLHDLRGQAVLINFWATWCAPCRIEMPAIQERYENLQDQGLTVLAVNFDEPQAEVQAFQDELGLSFPILLDPDAHVQSLYRVRGYPTSFFVDREGVIQVQHIGLMSESQLDDYLLQIGLRP